MSPRVKLRLLGAFGIWFIGVRIADLTGKNAAAGGILAILAFAVIVIIAGMMKKERP